MVNCQSLFGLFPANAQDDDIIVFDPNDFEKRNFDWLPFGNNFKKAGQPNLALADFIVPYAKGIKDYIGTFCVTTGYGVDKIAARLKKKMMTSTV